MEEQGFLRFFVLGIQIDGVQIPGVIAYIESKIKSRAAGHYIAAINAHLALEAHDNPHVHAALAVADLVVPDGMPLIWIGRFRGHKLCRRVYGPELMETFLKETKGKYRHFFYGGSLGIVERLAKKLKERYSDLNFAGTYSPPFRQLNDKEDNEVIELINQARADILWVGLGAPKQELWMYEHRNKLNVPVMVGVGAAFDFLAGVKPQAPRWMQEIGLEWVFRLITEPKRLWKRYIIGNARFLYLLFLEFADSIISKIGRKKSG